MFVRIAATSSCSLSRLQCHVNTINYWQCSLPLVCPQDVRRKHHVTTETSSNSCSAKRVSHRDWDSRIDGSTPLCASLGNCSVKGSFGRSHSLRMLRDERVNWSGLPLFGGSKVRLLSSDERRSSRQRTANRNTAMYAVAIAIAVTGLSYAAVPLYRIFCQASGYGGTVVKVGASEKVEAMEPIRERELTIRFNADTSSALLWQFRPHQLEIRVVPGETALAFYSARNPTDKPVVGIATYNVIPFEAGLYFNKIQCFCFEEQRLNPHEEVDMPVFFYIDPEFDDDPAMAKVNTITLSYTFFESKEGVDLPQPLTAS